MSLSVFAVPTPEKSFSQEKETNKRNLFLSAQIKTNDNFYKTSSEKSENIIGEDTTSLIDNLENQHLTTGDMRLVHNGKRFKTEFSYTGKIRQGSQKNQFNNFKILENINMPGRYFLSLAGGLAINKGAAVHEDNQSKVWQLSGTLKKTLSPITDWHSSATYFRESFVNKTRFIKIGFSQSFTHQQSKYNRLTLMYQHFAERTNLENYTNYQMNTLELRLTNNNPEGHLKFGGAAGLSLVSKEKWSDFSALSSILNTNLEYTSGFYNYKSTIYYQLDPTNNSNQIHNVYDPNTRFFGIDPYKSPLLQTFGLNISVTLNYSPTLIPSLTGYFESRNLTVFQNTDKDVDTIMGFSPSMNWNISRSNFVNFYYSFKHNRSSVAERKYKINMLGFSLIYKLSTL